MSIEQAVATLNAHGHRGRSDWQWSESLHQVGIPNLEVMPIHPIDAVVIASYYWHQLGKDLQ